jgi:Fe-S cluster assembly protein SufD
LKPTITTAYNLIQMINSIPDELLKLSQAGTNPKWVTHKINAISQYMTLDAIDAKSKLWKKLTELELSAPIRTVFVPEISGIKYEPWLDDWSGVMEISEEKISVYLNEELLSDGVLFKDIASSFDGDKNSLEKTLESSFENFEDRLSALTAGTVNHGFFLSVPEGFKVDKPFKVTVKISGNASYFPLRFVTVLKTDSSAKVVIEYLSEGAYNESCFIPSINSSFLDSFSELELIEIQNFCKTHLFFPNETIKISQNGILNRFILEKGSMTTRRTFAVDLNQPGGRAQVTGVYFPSSSQRFIYDTQQNHRASDTTSNLLFKGVLEGSAFALWKGNIFVKKGIQGADGYQLNNNLLLNPATHVESIPGLEISTDDVKCSHGVTVSSVDKDQLFYLQTRGISEDDGKNLIVEGFIRAAISRIKSAVLQDYVKGNLDVSEPIF